MSKQKLTLVSILAVFALLFAFGMALASDTNEVVYTGQGFTDGILDTEKCGPDADLGQDKDWVIADDGGYLKWILTAAGAESATITGPWGTFDMIQAGQGAYHKATDYYPIEELLAYPVTASWIGDVTGKVQLTVSNGCPGFVPKGEVKVTKTADTTYTREHLWDIAKKVETENEETVNGTPKIWLYIDGSGDETATWEVKVEYKAYKDKDFAVSGVIKVENTGNIPARVDDVSDYIETSSDIAAAVICPELPVTLEPGDKLECSYSATLPNKTPGTNFADASGVFLYPDKEIFGTFKETGTADITFGDPTTEINETVNVKDVKTVTVNDVSLTVHDKTLGTVTAPYGDTFDYDKEFKWADYGQDGCGSYTYDNTATIVETEQSASATLKVNVQCLIFKGETAWAANGDVPLELRYTQRGNWATYVKYAEKTTTLFAGQTIPVGTVTFSAVDNDKVTITVILTGDWEFEDVAENLKVQDYAEAPSGNPSPGLFDHKKTCDVDVNTCSIVVPANNFYGVHVNVGEWVPDPGFGSAKSYTIGSTLNTSMIFLPLTVSAR
jgi:hypothetical protein